MGPWTLTTLATRVDFYSIWGVSDCMGLDYCTIRSKVLRARKLVIRGTAAAGRTTAAPPNRTWPTSAAHIIVNDVDHI